MTQETFEKANKLFEKRNHIMEFLNNAVDWQNHISHLCGYGICINSSQHALAGVNIYPKEDELNAMLSAMIERMTSDLNELDRELEKL